VKELNISNELPSDQGNV